MGTVMTTMASNIKLTSSCSKRTSSPSSKAASSLSKSKSTTTMIEINDLPDYTDNITDTRSDTEIVKLMANGKSPAEEFVSSLDFSSGPISLKKGRISIIKQIGNGGYGNVFSAIHHSRASGNKFRALKVVHTTKMSHPNRFHEVKVLEYIDKIPESDRIRRLFVKFHGCFVYKNHLFMSFDLLGRSLGQILSETRRKHGFNVLQLKEIAIQLGVALSFLHQNEIIHMDIKPDNLVLMNSSYKIDKSSKRIELHRTHLRIIDFGSTILPEHKPSRAATTPCYTAPELILAHGLHTKADIWSMGCTLFECYNGRKLFSRNIVDRCYQMEAILCESIPTKIGIRSKLTCFEPDGHLNYKTRIVKHIHKTVKPLREYSEQPQDIPTQTFFDLLEKLLKINPVDRISGDEILRHDFTSGKW